MKLGGKKLLALPTSSQVPCELLALAFVCFRFNSLNKLIPAHFEFETGSVFDGNKMFFKFN